MIWRIEPATPGLTHELARLHGQAFTPGWSAQEFASLLQTPGAFALLGFTPSASEARAMALAWVVGDEAEILTLCSDPAHRRTGAALALVQHILVTAAAMGARAVFLEVAQTNVAARALYAGLGFIEAGRRENYYRTPDGRVDALVLRRELG